MPYAHWVTLVARQTPFAAMLLTIVYTGHMLFVVVEDGRGRVQGVWSKDRARGGPDQFASVAGALRVHQVCVVDGTVKQNRPGDRNEIAMDDVRVISDVIVTPRRPGCVTALKPGSGWCRSMVAA